MIPANRIKRILRWLDICGAMSPAPEYVHKARAYEGESYLRWTSRVELADKLFAHELEWLCRYALASMVPAVKSVRTHSRSEFKRLTAQGMNVLPPEFMSDDEADVFRCLACNRDVPAPNGAADDQPHVCNDCYDVTR